jgi:transcriptional regulator with XRE-family HTH domain
MESNLSSSSISQKIKRIRGDLSQTEFAKKVGINRSLISSYESGKKFPSFLSLQKLAQYANMTIDYLSGEDNSAKLRLLEGEDKFIIKFRSLPPKFKTLINELLEELTEHTSYKPKKEPSIND